MRRILIAFGILFGVLILLAGGQFLRMSVGPGLVPPPENSFRVASFNTHYIILGADEGRWSVGDWHRRRDAVDATFRALEADFVAFQEMESFARGGDGNTNLARDWLLANNPGYAAGASGDARDFPSTQPIFYRTDRYEMLDQGWFFFSETPEVIYSRTFNGSYPAFASWADFRPVEGGERFRILNLHTDYASLENRRRSIALVADRIRPWIAEGMGLIVVGDFNALHGSNLLDMLRREGVSFPRIRGATVHFDRGLNLFGAIDHIGHSDGLVPVGVPMVHRQRHDGVWPSDHYPLAVDFAR